MNSLFNKFVKIWESLGLNQERCVHCYAPFFSYELPQASLTARLCPQCQKLFHPYAGLRHKCCGLPVGSVLTGQSSTPDGICQNCQKTVPPWAGIAYHGMYAGPLRDLILRLKFDGELHLGPLFSDFLMQATQCLKRPDYVLCVPQHPEHLRKRGFNQAHEVATIFAKASGFRFAPNLLKRIRPGVPQEGLNAIERQANLRGAFTASWGVKDRTIWLVDDVMTTGSTMREGCLALLDAGAKEVYAVFLARTAM